MWFGEYRFEEEYNDEKAYANIFGNKFAGTLGQHDHCP
jgi:hypothetical protein